MPDGQRAKLIDGQFYNMAPPSRIYQEISYQISRLLGNYIESNGGKCRVYPPPFAVNLDADDKDWAEPDISLICDPNKLTDRGCSVGWNIADSNAEFFCGIRIHNIIAGCEYTDESQCTRGLL